MSTFGHEPESGGRQRDLIAAGFIVLLAFSAIYLPAPSQRRIAATLQGSVLRPFIATQQRLEEGRIGAARADSLVSLVDSLSGILSTHSVLISENRILRELLDLAERAGPEFRPATVLRPGTPGSESMFLIDLGTQDGVREGAPVVSPRGLVGVIREARPRTAVGMDWTHPDFRASAMLEDGTTYGLVENWPGRFREEDRLVLNGVPYNQRIDIGALVLTSGLGVLPRGIPIGRIEALRDEQGSWRRSYWLTPLVKLGAATHVLVMTERGDESVIGVWVADSVAAFDSTTAPPPRAPAP